MIKTNKKETEKRLRQIIIVEVFFFIYKPDTIECLIFDFFFFVGVFFCFFFFPFFVLPLCSLFVWVFLFFVETNYLYEKCESEKKKSKEVASIVDFNRTSYSLKILR